MVTEIRPKRGGFLRPFGCGLFIRDFLLGRGPYGSRTIDPNVGACVADIFYEYKMALFNIYAEEKVDRENELRILRGKSIYTDEEYEERKQYYLKRTKYNTTGCRYHSFLRYFHWLKQLGWVEKTNKIEESNIHQIVNESRSRRDIENYNAPQRIYYRITKKGIQSPDYLWSNPLKTYLNQM
jgi:hypothetical protein